MAKPSKFFKWIVKLRMWWADIRGHHGKRWDYEPGDWYMGRKKKTKSLKEDRVDLEVYSLSTVKGREML